MRKITIPIIYKLIKAEFLADLEMRVNVAIQEGYIPIGGPVLTAGMDDMVSDKWQQATLLEMIQ